MSIRPRLAIYVVIDADSYSKITGTVFLLEIYIPLCSPLLDIPNNLSYPMKIKGEVRNKKWEIKWGIKDYCRYLSSFIMEHGNAGFRVKNLRGTTGCPHYRGLAAPANATTKCAANGCSNRANRACHLLSANQNAISGKRLIAYLCASHNGIYNQVFSIRRNAISHELEECRCGTWP